MTAGWRTVRRNDPADQYPEMIKPSSPDFVVLARRTAARLAVVHGASADDLREVLEALGLIEPQTVSKPSARHRGQLGGSSAPAAPTAVSGGPTAGSRARSTDDKGRWTPKTRENPELCPKQLHPWIPDNQICRNDRGGVSCRLCYNATTRARKAKKRPGRDEPAAVETPKLEPGQRLCGKRKHVLPPGGNECVPCRYHRVNASRRKKTLAKAKELIAAEPTVEAAEFDTDGTPLLRCKRKWHHKPDGGPCLPCKQISRAKQTVRESEEGKT